MYVLLCLLLMLVCAFCSHMHFIVHDVVVQRTLIFVELKCMIDFRGAAHRNIIPAYLHFPKQISVYYKSFTARTRCMFDWVYVFAVEVYYGALHLLKMVYLKCATNIAVCYKYYGALHLRKMIYLKCPTNITVHCTF